MPGTFPGELALIRDDYLRWFAQMKEMHVAAVRIYTILPPHFYDALERFNDGRSDPLWLLQGIWSPEEQLIGSDQQGADAFTPAIREAFRQEIGD